MISSTLIIIDTGVSINTLARISASTSTTNEAIPSANSTKFNTLDGSAPTNDTKPDHKAQPANEAEVGLSSQQIGGIAGGTGGIVLLIAVGVWVIIVRCRKKRAELHKSIISFRKPELDGDSRKPRDSLQKGKRGEMEVFHMPVELEGMKMVPELVGSYEAHGVSELASDGSRQLHHGSVVELE
ncbi:hypothetical protein B0T17DRAFT_503362 [Bombardia bombarda]|uniref:Uncharacterized protein n=1 Tax=Bombardia bombarda TaxID=252184 RepID=A0AA39XKU2_9PEZI|nr:hypothetical protein B0T17DRAFT_503362 [Bombardia bombarda]